MNKGMTSTELRAWMVFMGKLRNKDTLSEREACALLGWSREPLRRALAGKETPRYIRLACLYLMDHPGA